MNINRENAVLLPESFYAFPSITVLKTLFRQIFTYLGIDVAQFAGLDASNTPEFGAQNQ